MMKNDEVFTNKVPNVVATEFFAPKLGACFRTAR